MIGNHLLAVRADLVSCADECKYAGEIETLML